VLRSGDTVDFLAESCGTNVETLRMHNPVLAETRNSEALPLGMPAKTSAGKRLPNYRPAALLVAGNPVGTKSCLMI
jgi:hypothetical protein